MKAGYLTFSSDEFLIEGEYHPPEGDERARCIVAHPHPQFGGSMDNNVVWALCASLPKAGIGALRFNFRGVGNSKGSFANGVGEAQDIASAVAFCREDFDKKVFVVGYSFGAYAASLAVDKIESLDAMALISPPVDMMDIDFDSVKSLPHFVICGDRDMFCSLRSLQVIMKKNTAPAVVKGADHFWGGFEDSLAQRVRDFFDVL